MGSSTPEDTELFDFINKRAIGLVNDPDISAYYRPQDTGLKLEAYGSTIYIFIVYIRTSFHYSTTRNSPDTNLKLKQLVRNLEKM